MVRFRSLVGLAGAALIAGTTAFGCGGDDSATTGGSGGTAGIDGAAGAAGSDGGGTICGNGTMEGTERCDDGNAVDDDGCTNTCDFTCTTDAKCNNGNACDGTETCNTTAHTCAAGTAAADGTSCGSNGEVCVGGSCQLASCGDQQVQNGEECDDGNVTSGDGCDACKFSCVSTDSTRNCSGAANECMTGASCNDATHVCAGGAPVTDGTACNLGAGTCQAGTCVSTVCGNSTTEGSEQCDDGNAVDTDGCKSDCTFTCAQSSDCNDTNSCTSDTCDTTAHTCTNAPDSTQDGQVCTPTTGGSGTCASGVCRPAGCGNGTTEGTEQCDDANTDDTDGCKADCTFTCTQSSDCDDANVCNGAETCDTTSHKCGAGTNASSGTACGTSPARVCNTTGACVNSSCGDTLIDARTEVCDDGNSNDTDGCTATCQYSCTSSAGCNDANSCTQDLCDTTAHTCSNPADAGQNGQPCTVSSVSGTCISGACTPANCGNSAVESGEQCDKGAANGVAGSGCTAGCQFECNANADCVDANVCNGSETCANVSGGKTCATGTPLSTGTACGTSPDRVCNASNTCVASSCGDIIVDPRSEVCDDGNSNNADGCTTACQYTCTSGAGCGDANSCTQDVCSNASHTCSNPADAGQNGLPCTVGATSGTCNNGVCQPAVCGNSAVESGEECDKGAANGVAGSGCSATCQFQCDVDADCADSNLCNGSETCATVSGGKTCATGTNATLGTVCNTNQICNGTGLCVNSVCGDSYVDASRSEQCEPPNTPTCSATCQTIVPVVCGNGTREATEQCDDGNTTNLDGCDSVCKYEPIFRITHATIRREARPAFCPNANNRLGTALTTTATGQLNPALQDGIEDGTTNIMVQALDLDDLTGVADPSLRLGVLTGALDPAKGVWPTTATNNVAQPIDWWFFADPTTVDANRIPTGLLTPANIAARQLDAGPGTVNLTLLLGGSPAALQMRNAKIRANVDGSPAPNFPAPPPASLDPAIRVAQTVTAGCDGTTAANGVPNCTGTTQGLCGDITVSSLAQIAAPSALTTGATACSASCSNSRAYTYCGAGAPVGPGCNSLLDVLIGGCRATFLCITAITPAQPDVVGTDGDVDTLTLGAGNKVPASQTTGNDDAYSAYLRFKGNRAHITGVQ